MASIDIAVLRVILLKACGAFARHTRVAARLLASVLVAGAYTGAMAQIAQEPLLTRNRTVQPNIMFTLDNSPSMTSIYSPGDRNMAYHPHEIGVALFDSGSYVTQVLSSTHTLFVAEWRSAASNPHAYNPATRYLSWAVPGASRMADANPRSATLRPNPTGAAARTVDLTITQEFSAKWCVNDPDTTGECATSTQTFVPMVYYKPRPPVDGRFGLEAYERIEIMDPARPDFDRSAQRTDCVSLANRCSRAEEMQNYANWFVYHRNRILIAIGSAAYAFDQLPDHARIGFGLLNSSPASIQIDGGSPQSTIVRGIRNFSGADRSSFFSTLYGVRLRGSTPLRRAVIDVGNYFSRTDARNAMKADPGSGTGDQLSCRRNFHILSTDGVWNDENDPTANGALNRDWDGMEGPAMTSVTGQTFQYTPSRPYWGSVTWGTSGPTQYGLGDIGFYFWSRDLRPDLPQDVQPTPDNPAFWQHLVHHTIALGVGGNFVPARDYSALAAGTRSWRTFKNEDTWHLAVNSRGRHFSASNSEEFSAALIAALDSITATASSAGVSASGRTMQAGLRKFVPEYRPGNWGGELSAYAVSADGASATTPTWVASQLIPAFNSRRIAYWDSRSPRIGRELLWSQLSDPMKSAFHSEDLLNYIRGDRSMEGSTFRRRSSLLGDIVNSAPLYVKDTVDLEYDFLPASVPGKSTYRAFLASLRSPANPGAVFVGANDGLLHVLQESNGSIPGDGVERFAFMPEAVMTTARNLADPAYRHQFYVDGSLRETHAYVRDGWKRVVLGTTGAGARSVFALDATIPVAMTATSALWEFNSLNDADVGYMSSPPAVGMVADGTWVAVFGNGQESASSQAILFVVNLSTGNLIRKINTARGSVTEPNGLSGVKLVLNGAKQIVGAYAGDIQGNVWAFDLSGSDPSRWTSKYGGPLFTARDGLDRPQPITSAPEYIVHTKGGNLVMVATGRLTHTSDVSSTTTHSIYGLWDWHDGTAERASTIGGRLDLVSQTHLGSVTTTISGIETTYYATSANTVTWAGSGTGGKRGWFLDTDLKAGQKTVYPLDIVIGKLLVQTVFPDPVTNPCLNRTNGGLNYLLDPLTGAGADKPVIDTNDDGFVNSADFLVSVYETAADGGDAAVVSPTGRTARLLSTSRVSRLISAAPARVRRSWRYVEGPRF